MVVGETVTGMSLEEFSRVWDEEGPFELIEGERIPVPTKMFGAITTANKLAFTINSHSIPKRSGEAFVEAPFILLPFGTTNWVTGSRVPDVMFLPADKLTRYKAEHPDWAAYPLSLVPNLVVEIVSVNDDYVKVIEKVTHYLRDGVQMVWLIDPQNRIITIYQANSKQQTTLSGDDKLNAGDLIPGFEIPLSEIWG